MGGNDTIFGDAGNDVLDAGTGSKLAVAFSGRDDVTASPAVHSNATSTTPTGRRTSIPRFGRTLT